MKRKLSISFLLIIAVVSVFAQAKMKKSGVYANEFIYEQAPFVEAHAATIAETPKGIVTAFFGGTKERNPDVCIYVCRQLRDMWATPVEVANGVQPDGSRKACWNPVLFQVPGGDLLLFYKVGEDVADWTGYVIRSKDSGITWSAPETLPEGFLGPVKNKPVMLKNGTVICPSSTEGKNGWRVHFEISTDTCKTWKKVGPINDGKEFNAIQPSVLELKDGRLQVLCRSRNRAILQSFSSDNGLTWTPMEKATLPNNNSGTDAEVLKDGRMLLVYNHVLPPGTETKGARTPLNVALSKDGKKWYSALTLEDEPGQYSYPSVIQSKDGIVHIVYTWKRKRIKYVSLDPAYLKLKKIKSGKWKEVKY